MTQSTLRAALVAATERLRRAGVAGPARDARKILYEAFETQFPDMDTALPAKNQAGNLALQRFDQMIAARAARVPMSHILGYREFYGRRFAVNEHVLDPRPETESLIERALASPFDTFLDLGTGSGAIIWTLLGERPNAIGVATDISNEALTVARKNPLSEDYSDRATFLCSDWYEHVEGRFDLIISNPPYITENEMLALGPEVLNHEPRLALYGGTDGLDCYRRIAKGARDHLNNNGLLAVEIGPTQARDVANLFEQAGFAGIVISPDLDGRDRIVSGRLSVAN